MIPILVVIGDAIALFGSFLAVRVKGCQPDPLLQPGCSNHSSSETSFLLHQLSSLGSAIGLVRVLQRLHSTKGTEGVSRAANSAVVIAPILIFVIDLIAVQITEFLGLIMAASSANEQPIIEIRDVHKSFGKNHVLRGFNLTLHRGENVVVLGRSGCGKSVLIKCIVG